MPSRYNFSRFASTPGKGDLLFHYTTMAGFLGIFDSGVIYASHIQYLNDSAEFTYAINRTQEELRSLNAAGEFAGDPALAASIAEFEAPRRSQLPAVYVTSFSERRDLLSQWRAYAPRGGVSIGLNAAKLAERAADREFWLAQCVYEEAEWRLISYASSSTDSIRAVGFRTDGSMVIPYGRVPLNQGEGRRVDLAEAIVVGPTPHPELSKASIALMMYKRNLSPRPRVENSKVPYRNW